FIVKTIAVSVIFLLLQVSLGISNIIFSLPIAVATAHNGVAVLLLLSLLTLVFQIKKNHA
ncbi:MAG: COX15/CtaA family protein, partial [Candidatus Oxydemutatoraceae bacterium WSBS_2016_MAG_OTU14]